MAKNRRAPIVNLTDFKKKLEEEHSVVIRTDRGDFRYRGPQLLTDDEMKEMLALEKSEDPGSSFAVASLMVDDYEGFVAAGGSMAVLQEIVDTEQKRRAGQLDEDDDDAEAEAAEQGEGEASSSS